MNLFNNNESKYNNIFTFIDNKWTCQFHRPLHAATHFLNLVFYYSNPEMEYYLEVTNRLYAYIKILVPTKDVQQKNLTNLSLYKIGSGLFGGDFAKNQEGPRPQVRHLKLFLNCIRM